MYMDLNGNTERCLPLVEARPDLGNTSTPSIIAHHHRLTPDWYCVHYMVLYIVSTELQIFNGSV